MGKFTDHIEGNCQANNCEKKAEFIIHDNNETRPDMTDTLVCEEHVGSLLGSVEPTKPESWTVIAI